MLVILPFVAEEMPEVEANLSGALILEEMASLEPDSMKPEIYLPRFKIEFETGLKEPLMELGVASIFDETAADLTGMIDARLSNVAVSKIIHKAAIEVNEEGTEAAAATGIDVAMFSLPPQMMVDRPFLFAVVHRPTATPVFVGRMSKPSPVTVD